MKINYETLKALLEKLKNDTRLSFFLYNLDFFDKVCDHILLHPINEEYNFKKLEYLSEEDSFGIAKDILNQLSSNYPMLLDYYKKEDMIKIEDESNSRNGSGNVSYRDGKLVIRYGLHYDINDVYLIVHEFMHSLNTEEQKSASSKLFSESFAVYSEFLTFDYLEKNNICSFENNEMLKLRMHYFNKRIKQLKDYIEEIKYLKENYDKISKSDDVSIIDEADLLACVDYSLAGIISTILLYRKETVLFSNEEFTKLNEMIKNSNVETMTGIIFPNRLDLNEFLHGYDDMMPLINKEKSL